MYKTLLQASVTQAGQGEIFFNRILGSYLVEIGARLNSELGTLLFLTHWMLTPRTNVRLVFPDFYI
jgi:hypothetical protein